MPKPRGITIFVDPHRDHRDVVADLTDSEIDDVRQCLEWMINTSGFTYSKIGEECKVPAYTVRRFITGSNVNDKGEIGNLVIWLSARSLEIPTDRVVCVQTTQLHRRDESIFTTVIKKAVPTSADEIKKIFDNYSGYYICFVQLPTSDLYIVYQLHIWDLIKDWDPNHYPLPRFTITTKFSDKADPTHFNSVIFAGYAQLKFGQLQLIGQSQGQVILINFEEYESKLRYLIGMSLLPARGRRNSIAGKIFARYIGKDDPDCAIGVMPIDECKRVYADFEVIQGQLEGVTSLSWSEPK